jgi:elongation factor P
VRGEGRLNSRFRHGRRAARSTSTVSPPERIYSHGFNRGHQERRRSQHGRPALDRDRLPAREAGQGWRLRVVDRTFNAGAKIETETVDRSEFQYLYADGENYVFMDVGNYDQITLSAAQVGDAANFMLENQNVTIALHNGDPLYVELPASVTLEITYTEPGLQGDRSTGGTKPATVETGYQIQVPLFLEQGTKVKVDTRDGSYLGRVN